MSLFSTPFVGESTDIILHGVAFFIMIISILGTLWVFWKIHDIPVHKAKKKNKFHQLELVTAFTWIGFFAHWVWIVAVFIAFIDFEKLIKNIKVLWIEIENIKGDTNEKANEIRNILKRDDTKNKDDETKENKSTEKKEGEK